ncbi:MAG TPA: class I SAM-dependent methyltransferase [Pyrinomonadaceae bacterium]|nr:class I SAM-dependent methyltransferase [Pyrinomonadaceae bacterium]
MSNYSGVLKIIRFNWPWYAAAVALTLGMLLCLFLNLPSRINTVLVVGALVISSLWMLLSLAVSHYVYDRSSVGRGTWLSKLVPSNACRGAIFHAGQDEVSPAVARQFPTLDFQVFDFYDERRNGTDSLRRARALNQHRDLSVKSDEIPVADSAFDLALVVFAAHEIRDESQRTAFFREIRRVLTPSGRLIVAEHLRDSWNFIAYGPGAFHFLSERTWRRSFASAELKILRETNCTRFVRVFELQKNG